MKHRETRNEAQEKRNTCKLNENINNNNNSSNNNNDNNNNDN